MRNQLSDNVNRQTNGLITIESYTALYAVLLCAENGVILLLPVRFRHVRNAET